MDQALVAQKIEELRNSYPAMFSHKEAGSSEVWVGDRVVDVIGREIGLYHGNGMPSARKGKAFMKSIAVETWDPSTCKKASSREEFTHFPIFVDKKEFALAILADKKSHSQSQPVT